MKILHTCLIGSITDNFTYQDNVLPKYHKKMWHEVQIIANQLHFVQKDGRATVENDSRREYINENGIKVIRLPFKKPLLFYKRLKRFVGLLDVIESFEPDIIFVHGCQFLDIDKIAKYAKKHKVRIFVDNHADFSNSATNWLSKNVLHKIIWKRCLKKIEPFTERFYGVLPVRVDVLKELYNAPADKTELLIMGADDELVVGKDKVALRKELNAKYNFDNEDFVIVSGGKLDKHKNMPLLMQAVAESNMPIKLLVFGNWTADTKDDFLPYANNEKINYLGWLGAEEPYDLFLACDLAIFPGRHSVLWEQAAACGVPCAVKWWQGTDHININGNCEFLHNDSVEEIKTLLEGLCGDNQRYLSMKEKAAEAAENFMYSCIAEQSIR